MATVPKKYLNQYISTVLNVGGGIDASQTTGIVLQSVSGVDITKPGIICIGWANPLDTSSAEWISYTSINGSNELQGVTRGVEGFTAKSHSNGATIVFPLSESHINDLNDMFESVGVDIKQISTPANPDSGRNKIYVKSDDKPYILTSGGVETAILRNGDVASAPTDGWNSSSDTWTYASASTFTIAGVDRTAVYTKGTRLKFTQTTVKYAVVVSSSFSTNTTVTIAVNTDYTIANAAITSPYYSYEASPAGYPGYFNYTPTWTNLTVGNATVTAVYSLFGETCTLQIKLTFGTTTSMGTGPQFTLPISCNTNLTRNMYPAYMEDAGVFGYYGFIQLLSTTNGFLVRPNGGSVADITSTAPFTWGNTDFLVGTAIYKIA